MKSGISFFNSGIAKNYLKRFWALWTAYLGILIFALPVNALNAAPAAEGMRRAMLIENAVLYSGINMVYISAAFCAAAALAVFSFMYTKRSCGMINSMPVRRETMFSTAVISGLGPMLTADVLVFAATALIFAARGEAKTEALVLWLALTVMGNVTFFGIAVFSAMLTGSALIMPLVYGIVNFAAFVAESEISWLLSKLVYGFSTVGQRLSFLSPIVKISEVLSVIRGKWSEASQTYTEFSVTGMGYIAAYCVAGLALLALSLLLYRRRNMERAGDTAAYAPLRALFKYCMTFGTAPIFAVTVFEGFFEKNFSGFTATVILTVFMVIGAFIGYFGARMILEKTMNVFRCDWWGYVICACALIVAVFACDFDLVGYETKLPDASEVEEVAIGNVFAEPENIERAIALHKIFIENKSANEANHDYAQTVNFSYRMKDGSVIRRRYQMEENALTANDESSAYSLYAELQNTSEGRRQRCELALPMSRETFATCEIQYMVPTGGANDSDYRVESMLLNMDEALALYACVIEDAENARIADFSSRYSREYFEKKTNVNIYFETSKEVEGEEYRWRHDGITYTVQLNSEKTLEWLSENTDIEIVPLKEVNPDGYKQASGETVIIGGADGPTAMFVTY